MTLPHIPLALISAAAFIAAAINGAPAYAASSVFGPGPAGACFDAAVAGDASPAAITECDTAISGRDLSVHDRAATLVNRGILHLVRRDGRAALADFDLSIRLKNTLGEAFVNRGAALILLGRDREAIEAISHGLALGSNDPQDGHFNRAIAYERLGETAAAYQDFKRASELKPDWVQPKLELTRFSVQAVK